MNEKIKIELTIEEVNGVLSGILELPGKIGLHLYSNVKSQAEEQLRQTQTEE